MSLVAKNGPPKLVPRKSKGSVVSTTYELPYQRQAEHKTLKQIIYDRDNGKVLGRTPKNWGQIILFYVIFYIALAALFTICMKGLFMTIDTSAPKWKLGESLIGTNPGLGFRPMSHNVDQGSLIWYDSANKTQISYWSTLLDEFMEENTRASSNQKICDFGSLPNPGQVCKQDIESFKNCTTASSYGYEKSAPCIFLKLNRIFGWEPQFFNDPNDLPDDMPKKLKDHIGSLNATTGERNQIWVTCYGENAADTEVLGDIEYYPSRGFPGYFYPYVKTQGYVSPLVAVKFVRPKTNRIINIECRAWAKNINYVGSHRDRQGSVHLELMIDKE